MPRVPLTPLLWANWIVLGLGGLVALGLLLWLRRRGEFRDPLAGGRCPGRPDTGNLLVAGAIGVYLASGLLPQQIIAAERFRADPGTHEYFVATSIALGIRVLLGLAGWWLLMRLLRRPTSPGLEPLPMPAARPAMSFGSQWGVVLSVGLAALAICTAQAELMKAAWSTWAPEVSQPQHVVLEALQRNAWGLRGEGVLAAGAVLVAPLFEEVIFRGLLLVGLWQMAGTRSAWPAVLGSGVLFGLIHYPVPQTIVPLVTFGIILGMVQVRTGQLWIAIAIHAVFNLRTMATVLLNPGVLEAGF